MNKKISLAPIVVFFSLLFAGQPVQAEVKSQKITSLAEPTWVFKTGMSRAKYHDRQDLGVILNAGATIKIRKSSNADGYKSLSLWFLANDRKLEQSVTVTNDWQTVTTTSSVVPFINTPYGEKNAEIEYEIEGASTQLPIYDQKNSEAAFFSDWDASNAGFGLIKSDKFQLLIPGAEKNKTRKLSDFTSLADYMSYQDSIINYYDGLMGLTASDGINKTPENRFFLKADCGAGSGVGAYYGGNYSANGDPTVVNMWMTKWNWGTLHELGHAYQPAYGNKGMYTGEVANNLLAVLFTYEHRGKADGDKKSWLYNYNKKQAVEASLYDALINNEQGYAGVDLRRRLILLTDLTQSVGKENWTKLNVFYREAINNGDTAIQNLSLPDLFTLYYSSQTKKDYSPVFNKWGLSLTASRQPTINRGNDYPGVVSLIDVVPKSNLDAAVSFLSDKLLIDSQFALITNQDIAGLQLPGGALSIHLKIDEFDQLKGKTLQLKNGPEIVKEVRIDSPDLLVENLKNGIYTIAFPETAKRYTISNYYGYVRDAQNETTVNFTELVGSQLFDEVIAFKGIQYDFAYLKTELQRQKMTVDVFLERPHLYYAGELYASIQVFDEAGKQIYEKMIEGTNVQKEKIELPLKEGYQIKIFHAETKNRLRGSTAGLINLATKTNVLLLKNGHLVNQDGTSSETIAVDKILTAIADLKVDASLSDLKRSPEKDQIIVAILALPQVDRDKLLVDHQDFLNLKPGQMTIHYLDDKGMVISPPDFQAGRFGETIKLQAKAISGYALSEEIPEVDLAYQLNPTSHTFIYKKRPDPILPKNKLLLKDVVLIQGEIWDPEMHIAELIKDSEAYTFADAVKSGALTYIPKCLDTSKVGTYTVTYSYEGVSSTAQVTVKASKASIDVKDSKIKVGDSWAAVDNFISATDSRGKVVEFDIKMVSGSVDTTKVGVYDIKYSHGSAVKRITVTVEEKTSSEKTPAAPETPVTPEIPALLETPLKPQNTATQAIAKEKKQLKRLPKTGEQKTYLAVILGLLLVVVSLYCINHKYKASD